MAARDLGIQSVSGHERSARRPGSPLAV
jgi:hypothetical protein